MEGGFRMIDEIFNNENWTLSRSVCLFKIIKLREIFTILVYLTNARVL